MKIVRESLYEGVADVIYDRLGITNSEYDMPTDKSSNMIGYVNSEDYPQSNRKFNSAVYKNHSNISDFPKKVRGIITDTGDLYICENSKVLHDFLILFLINKGIITRNKEWYVTPTTYIGVQKLDDTTLALCESHYRTFDDNKDHVEEYKKYIPFLRKAKHINPKINFICQNITDFR